MAVHLYKAGVRFGALNNDGALKHDPSQTDEGLTAVSVNKMENMTTVAETIFFFSSNTKHTHTHAHTFLSPLLFLFTRFCYLISKPSSCDISCTSISESGFFSPLHLHVFLFLLFFFSVRQPL